MGHISVTERAILDQMEPRWLRRGYQLIRHPSRNDLPEFLRGFQPDAIAIGAQPSLVIEIVNPRSKATKARISQLGALFENQEEWKLEVIYALSESGEISISSGIEILQALDDGVRLIESEPRAALLLVWAAFEAAARRIHPDLASQGLTSGSLIELLISQGDLRLDDQEALRSIALKRNAVAHGDLTAAVDREEVERIADASRALLGRKRLS
jgi:hypothetical protein